MPSAINNNTGGMDKSIPYKIQPNILTLNSNLTFYLSVGFVGAGLCARPQASCNLPVQLRRKLAVML